METINIRLAAFEGPLDLLYHLIEKKSKLIFMIFPIAAADQNNTSPIWMRQRTGIWTA